MITDINNKSTITVLNKLILPPYWMQYFKYENDKELFDLSQTALIKKINGIKKSTKYFVNSQIIVSEILTEFGAKSLFHREFNEKHPELCREQVLGMQLYNIMVKDNETWIYYKAQHSLHLFPHMIYFQYK